MAGDLHKLMTKLDLRDATLAGFSMGGGEVARYLGAYGSERVEKAVFISSIPPFLLKTPDNPDGVDGSVFDGLKESIAKDRPAFLSAFLSDFYNFDVFGGDCVSDEVVRLSRNVAADASPKGTLDCVTAFSSTDFRSDLQRIDVPILIVHGDTDRIVPFPDTINARDGIRTHGPLRERILSPPPLAGLGYPRSKRSITYCRPQVLSPTPGRAFGENRSGTSLHLSPRTFDRLPRTLPDQPDPEYQETNGEDHRSGIREVDQRVRLRRPRVEHGEEEAERQQDRGDRDRLPHDPFEPVREVRLVNVAQRDKREDEDDAGMSVPGPPQGLPQGLAI